MCDGAFVPGADARAATSADVDDALGDVGRQIVTSMMLRVHVGGLEPVRWKKCCCVW